MPADPPSGPTTHPPASVHSLWRLRSYLRPHIPSLVIMLVTSMTGVAVAIMIPLVIKALIDGPIEEFAVGKRFLAQLHQIHSAGRGVFYDPVE